VTAGKGLALAGRYRVTHYKQGILSDCWQRVVISGKLLVTHFKQGILSDSWQMVVISGRLYGYTLQTRNTE
jgi:hypothetical protein